jgi:hypothetical protein
MGLSWHRAGRSISVRAWLDKLNTGRAAGELPCAHDLESATETLPPTPSFRATALFVVLLMCVTVWVSVARLAGRKLGGGDPVPAVPAGMQLDTGPVPAPESAGPSVQLPAASAAMDAGPLSAAVLNTPSQTSETQSQVVSNTRREVNRPRLPAALTNPLFVSASNYRVRSGERFAEIRVHRSSLGSDTPFVWWTEAASAKPGIDYVHQGKVVQSFPKGKSSTSFFVKLVPTASRAQPEVFYIAIADAGHGAASSKVARAAVWLPTNHDQSQPSPIAAIHASPALPVD